MLLSTKSSTTVMCSTQAATDQRPSATRKPRCSADSASTAPRSLAPLAAKCCNTNSRSAVSTVRLHNPHARIPIRGVLEHQGAHTVGFYLPQFLVVGLHQ